MTDVAMADDGSVVLVWCSNEVNAAVSNSATCSTSYDVVAVKLDSEGNEVWTWQVRP